MQSVALLVALFGFAVAIDDVVTTGAAPSGKYTASVPFILTMTLNFNNDGTMDFDNNVKIAHQEINCPKTKVAITDTAVTFPNIGNTGDCMGDALRGQKKDVTKFKVDINSDGTLTFHSDGWPDLKLKKASEVVEEALDTCSLYGIAGDACEQSDIDCKYTKYAKLAEKSLLDGTCASKGYTVKGSTTTKSYPFVGKIVITKYTKASEVVEEALATCSLYGIDGDACEQSDIDCAYTKYAKLAEKSLKDGTCASKGYTVKGSTTTKSYPFVGKIVITKYTTPSATILV